MSQRFLAVVVGSFLALAASSALWDWARFGRDEADAVRRLERDVGARVSDRANVVTATALRVARTGDLVARATASRDDLPALFARLSEPGAAYAEFVSATVWVPGGLAGEFRELGWTDGPAEDVTPSYLNRAPGLFVANGASGLILVAVQPIDHQGRRVGVAAAETPLSLPAPAGPLAAQHRISSWVGPLAIEPLDGSSQAVEPDVFRFSAPADSPLVSVRVSAGQLADARRLFRWRAAAVALIPAVLLLAALLAGLNRRRRRTGTAAGWAAWSAAMAALIAASAVAAAWVLRQAAAADAWHRALEAAALMTLAALLAADAWRRAWPRRQAPLSIRFVAEHGLGGLVLAGAMLGTEWLWRTSVGMAPIDRWRLPLLPSSLPATTELLRLFAAGIAVAWVAGAVLGGLSIRWRLSWRKSSAWVAIGCWILPGAVLEILARDGGPSPGSVLVMASTAAAFGVSATALRRAYRRGSEARRLVLQFSALFLPLVATYPLAASSTDRAMGQVVETEYAPETQAAQQPDRLMSSLTAAWTDIDGFTELPDLLREAGTSVNSTQLAFRLWNRTVLSRERITSQVELYGPDRTLVSRFALNVPEFGSLTQAADRTYPGTGCDWDAFAEVARFGAGERRMLRAERALCGAGGEFLGAVVVRILPDYRTLPFVASANPYYEALGAAEPSSRGVRVPELQVVVYGWSLQPVFVSGGIVWPLDPDLAERVSRSREPFWADRALNGRTYHLRVLNDRGGIYAVGYPTPTPLQHATRLAETAALVLVLFVAYLTARVIRLPLTARPATPLARLFREIRASFYRKLFLFFVLAAIAPVVLFAVAFGAYMTEKLRADVESEASSVVIVARRVLDELSAAEAPPGQARPVPGDDLMVWIRQVVDQDVNLFEGAELLATSQRDLFDSGLLPTRTPASVYRRVALDRQPVAVVEDQIGTFRYLVAAAPVPALGRETVLTVPLASRQREIERQIDELTQGVLTGAVVLVLFAAALGASVAGRVSDPVARLTRATRLVAAGQLDQRIAADTADELGRLVDDFNAMTRMLLAQRAELARANQLKAWAEMSRQVAHEIKNPLTPVQLAAEHLQRVHDDAGRPMGAVVDQCLGTILTQVRLLRTIAAEFSTFAGEPTPRFESLDIGALVARVLEPYQAAPPEAVRITSRVAPNLPPVRGDRTLLARAFTNLVENALQAMPGGGQLEVEASSAGASIVLAFADTGVGMDEEGVSRAFEPYFSTKTGGSGLGLANARRNVEMCGGRVTLASREGEGTTVTVTVPIAPPGAPAAG